MKPHLAPLTYFLFAVNVFVFMSTYDRFKVADHKMDVYLTDERFLSTQGSAFGVLIRDEPKLFSKMFRQLEDAELFGDMEARKRLGSLAFRNHDFMIRADSYDFHGDEIALKEWHTKFVELKRLQNQHPSFQWGVSENHDTIVNWLTYQFAHSGFAHLFGNMLFLLIFGTFVELKLGSSFVILTYLGAGLLGVCSFSLLSGITTSPLVGASAAISGLISLVAFGFWGKKLKYFYWFFPLRGYYGFVMLPSWIVLMLYMLPDLAGYFEAVPELGSIAYTAHIGGATFGFLMAMLYRSGWLETEIEEGEEENGVDAYLPEPIDPLALNAAADIEPAQNSNLNERPRARSRDKNDAA